MKTTSFFLVIALLLHINVFSQVLPDTTKPKKDTLNKVLVSEPFANYLPNFSPLSPNAASFQKYGDFAVNLATGVPDISIPLFTVTEGGLSIPIVLRYHAGGHRLTDKASWVGWGWSLEAGGSVNRRVNGLPDDVDGIGGTNYLNTPIAVNPDLCNNSVAFGYADALRNNNADAEADIYAYSVPSKAGRYLLGQGTDEALFIPYQPHKVERIGNPISGFRLWDELGTLYEFGNGATESQQEINGRWSKNYISTWHLTAISSATTDDKLTLSYQDGGFTALEDIQWGASMLGDATGIYQNSAGAEAKLTRTTSTSTIQHLHKITFTNGEVEFVQSTVGEVRADVPTSRYLKQINRYAYEEGVKQLQRSIEFVYSYFTDIDNANGRLKLDSVRIKDADGVVQERYSFAYWSNTYSWKESDAYRNQRDYFGFFNGASSNQSLLTLSSYTIGSTSVPITYGGANRSTSAQYLKEGVLKQMTYPTKGFTTFDFEPNQYKHNGTTYLAGGLRVKEIKSYSDSLAKPLLKRYEYGSAEGVGVGKLPTSWFPTSEQLPTVEHLAYAGDYSTSPNSIATRYLFTNNSPLDMGGLDGTPVFYTSVKEYFEGATDTVKNGYNDYTFSFEADLLVNSATARQRGLKHWKRGQLLNKKTYTAANVLVQQVTNSYADVNESTRLAGAFVSTAWKYEGSFWTINCSTGLKNTWYQPEMVYHTYSYNTGASLLTSTTTVLDGVSSSQSTTFDSYLQPIQTTTDRSNGTDSKRQLIYYATDASYASDAVATEMRNRHILAVPLEQKSEEVTLSGVLPTSHHKRVFGLFAGTNAQGYSHNLLPKEEWVAPTGSLLEKRVEYTQYDTAGNLLAYFVDGIPTTLLWSYDNSLLVAEIKNATFSTVQSALSSSGIVPSSYNVSVLDNTQLTALQSFRNALPSSLVTWYTYRPHIGLSSSLSPNGLRTSYAYDGFGRLKSSKDNQGNLTDVYQYKYADIPFTSGQLNLSIDKNAIIHSVFRKATTDSTKFSDIDFAVTTIQYLDGLGRPIQKVGYQHSSATYNDIILENTHYDSFGRTVKTTLPTPADLTSNGSNGSYKPYADVAASIFYNDLKPYTETTAFDNSPLNRPQVMYGAGQAWRDSLRNMQLFYGVAGSDVRYYTQAVNGDIVLSGNYPANSLFKQITVDEQRDTTITLTDKQGRMIEQRVQDANGYMVTHYVYDAQNRPLAIIQPEGYKIGISLSYNSTLYQNYVFAYEYDIRGRVSRKHIPNGGWTSYVYDKLDRVVLEQSAQQATANRWSFTKYDALGRVALTGELESTQSRASLQTAFNGVTTPHETRNVNTYTNVSFPSGSVTGNYTEYQFFYYDNYDWIQPEWELDTNYRFNGPALKLQNATGLNTGYWSRNGITSNEKLHRTIYYDNKNRFIQQVATHPQIASFEDSTTRMGIQYYFDGQEFWGGTRFKGGFLPFFIGGYNLLNQMNEITFKYHWIIENNIAFDFEIYQNYDGIKRLKKSTINPDNTYNHGVIPDYINLPPNPTVPTTHTARKAVIFNEGTLIDPQQTGTYGAYIDPNAPTGSTYGLQTMDYAYHIRGGLLGINLDVNKAPYPKSYEGDLFSFKLDYEAAGKWDGNIGKQTWNNHANELRSYTYGYDAAKRLTAATYAGVNGENFSLPQITYDKNGNIKKLQRYGSTGAGSYGLIDNLTYGRNGNRLQSLTDASSSPEGFKESPWGGGFSFGFYADGSLKHDDNEQIQNIVYDTYLKQPTEVQLYDGRKIKNYYDGGGTLLKTVYLDASNGVVETWEYRGEMVFKNGQPYQIATPEGRAVYTPPSGAGGLGAWHYEFDYTDYLGNTRVSFRDSSGVLVKTAESHFDPWGLSLKGIGQVNGTQNRFELQGHEKEMTFGLNRVNFGARTLNPTTGVWDRVDAFAEQAPHLTPYRYAFNNPVNVTDPDGNFEYTDGYGTYSSEGASGAIDFNGTYQTQTKQDGCPPNCGAFEQLFGNPKTKEDANTYANKKNLQKEISQMWDEAYKTLEGYFSYIPFGRAAWLMNEGLYEGDNTKILSGAANGAFEAGGGIILKGGKVLPIQVHHFATNKSKTFTPQMEAIAKEFGLNLNGAWNKQALPHLGRHPNDYHKFVLQGMQKAKVEARGSQAEFIRLFEEYVKQPVIKNLELLRKSGW